MGRYAKGVLRLALAWTLAWADMAPSAGAQQGLVPALSRAAKPVSKAGKTSKTANVKRGSIAAIDASLGKLTLKSAAGIAADYGLTEKTRYWKGRHVVDAAAFTPGDAVVVHLRHSRKTDTMQVIELDDRTSWDWLDALRHRTAPATVIALDDDTLSVTVGTDNLPFTYVLSPDTLWSRAGRTVQPADFKPGDRVYVVPRSLPGGEVQARAVADSAPAATVLKERVGTSVRGTIRALDSTAHTLTLITTVHDTRILTCEVELEVLRGGKPLAWTDLKVGQSVSARLHRNADDKPVAWRITIQNAHTRLKARKHTVSGQQRLNLPTTRNRVRTSP
jgi:hypothetical protein